MMTVRERLEQLEYQILAPWQYIPNARFRHYEQSLRVVDLIEKDGRGLNLTHEVREGIVGHSKGRADLTAHETQKTVHLEATVVRIADCSAAVFVPIVAAIALMTRDDWQPALSAKARQGDG